MIVLANDDALVYVSGLPSDSVDSLVTDPPAGIGFMGKAWDGNKGGREQWVAWMSSIMGECLRVLKPGAHGLVWALPRTSHWTATALEDAGFEVRDVVTHVFGSGFPKSRDISKDMDKYAGAVREVIGEKFKPNGAKYPPPSVNSGQAGAFGLGGHSLTELYEMRDRGVRNTIDGKTVAASIARGERKILNPDGHLITGASSPEAKQWDGWGTALKPASEHWLLVRKPIEEKTVAKNVLKHGTGGLNIDASRITQIKETQQHLGRFPANFMLSHHEECAVAELDKQSLGGDTGGASRFFYCAKASRKDKNEGLEGMPEVLANVGDDRPSGNMNQRLHGKANRPDIPRANHHPTVKSSKLMEYLIKLITPPAGVVLDPFMGSGSTGVAALKAGFGFVGIEADQAYHSIACARIASFSQIQDSSE